MKADGPRKKGEGHQYAKFESAKRAEMILLARGHAKDAYGDFDLTDFSRVSVFKKSGEYKVVFRAPYVLTDRESKTTNIFAVHVSEAGAILDPHTAQFLTKFPPEYRKIAALFGPDDSLNIKVHPAHFEVTASRSGGGAEGYTIDKKTFEKKMTWHEHPNPSDDSSELVAKPGSRPSRPLVGEAPEEWIEITE